MTKCDICAKVGCDITLKVPDKYCEHCKSDLESTFYVCSNECLKKLVNGDMLDG